MIEFPTDTDCDTPVSLRSTNKLPIIVHPTYRMFHDELNQLAPLLKVNPKVLTNNYDHYVGDEAPKLFKCEPYSRLKIIPERTAIGITVMPLTLLRYGTIRTEHLRDMTSAAQDIGRGLAVKHGWSDAVKEAYALMSITAAAVNDLFPAGSVRLRQARVSYHLFSDRPAFFSIYELCLI
jgi:hypothetical protein